PPLYLKLSLCTLLHCTLPRPPLLPSTTLFRSRLSAYALLSPFGLAMITVLWAYEGWQFGTYSAGEVIEPQKCFPRAFLYGSLIRSKEHTSELQSLTNLVCRLLLEKKKHKHSAR